MENAAHGDIKGYKKISMPKLRAELARVNGEWFDAHKKRAKDGEGEDVEMVENPSGSADDSERPAATAFATASTSSASPSTQQTQLWAARFLSLPHPQ